MITDPAHKAGSAHHENLKPIKIYIYKHTDESCCRVAPPLLPWDNERAAIKHL